MSLKINRYPVHFGYLLWLLVSASYNFHYLIWIAREAKNLRYWGLQVTKLASSLDRSVKVLEELLVVQEHWLNLTMLGRPCLFSITNCAYNAPPTKAPKIKKYTIC